MTFKRFQNGFSTIFLRTGEYRFFQLTEPCLAFWGDWLHLHRAGLRHGFRGYSTAPTFHPPSQSSPEDPLPLDRDVLETAGTALCASDRTGGHLSKSKGIVDNFTHCNLASRPLAPCDTASSSRKISVVHKMFSTALLVDGLPLRANLHLRKLVPGE